MSSQFKPHRNHPQSYVAAMVHLSVNNTEVSLQELTHKFPLPTQNPRFAYHCLMGTVRWFEMLSSLAAALCVKKPPIKGSISHCILLVGLYQLLFLNQTEAVSVNETVKACRKLKQHKATGFINGCLRQFLRKKSFFQAQLMQNSTAMFSHPKFLVQQIKQDWPQHYRQIIASNNSTQPYHLRLNLTQHSQEQFLQQCNHNLGRCGIIKGQSTAGILVPKNIDVTTLPKFNDGGFYIQNIGAQFLPLCLEQPKNMTILDGCAGVGGKTFQLLELYGQDNAVVAVEPNQHQVKVFQQNSERLKLTPDQLICQDLIEYAAEHPEPIFDIVVLDVPCSSTGVIAKHPELKYRTTAKRLKKIIALQQQLLAAAWQLVKPGGACLYLTCSILRSENDRQVQQFITLNHDAESVTFTTIPNSIPCHYGQQVLPGEHSLGFYYAKIRKKT